MSDTSLDAQALSAWRRAKGLSRPELARRAGLSRQFVRLIEAGERRASERSARALAKALGVKVSLLRRKPRIT